MSESELRDPPSFADVEAAAQRLAGVAHRTQLVTSRMLDDLIGVHVVLKAEGFQRMGAFKFRGAYNAIYQLTAEERRRGVVTTSSGNGGGGLFLSQPVVSSQSRTNCLS